LSFDSRIEEIILFSFAHGSNHGFRELSLEFEIHIELSSTEFESIISFVSLLQLQQQVPLLSFIGVLLESRVIVHLVFLLQLRYWLTCFILGLIRLSFIVTVELVLVVVLREISTLVIHPVRVFHLRAWLLSQVVLITLLLSAVFSIRHYLIY
jgi:hypothetical protein